MRTILIVDDDEDDRDFLCEAIYAVDKATKCVCVSDGIHALNILLNADFLPPDFIFLDLNMPRLGGKQCLERIKQVPRLVNVPVIIFTTSKLKDDIKESMKLGAVYFLTKPTSLSELKTHVQHVLKSEWKLLEHG